jgi:two-component system sensor histidine kinase KdpD
LARRFSRDAITVAQLGLHWVSFEPMRKPWPSGLFSPKGAARIEGLGQPQSCIGELGVATAAIVVATAVSFLVAPLTGHVGIALLYLLLVVLAGLTLTRWPVLLVASASALIWNFLFILPRFTVYIEKIEDVMLLAMFFVVAIALGHTTHKLRGSQLAQEQREQRTAALYELVRQAGLAHEVHAGLRAALALVEGTFGVKAALLLRLKDHTLSRETHAASSFQVEPCAIELAENAFTRGNPIGRFTQVMPDADAMYLPLKGRSAVMGVLVILPSVHKRFGAPEKDLIETFAVLIGTILERDHLLAALKHAEIIEASERLQRALLQSVSHELKTPLAAVQAGVETLAGAGSVGAKEERAIPEIQTALRRLGRVINNLLNMSRIESGVVQPMLDWCDVAELIENSIALAGEAMNEHRVSVDSDPTLPMVKLDQALMEQCLCNLLLNAAAWSAAQSRITVSARLRANDLLLKVQDEGKGMAPADLPRVFDTFYRGEAAKPGGTGLGLAIVDGFVRAHGGNVRAANRHPWGAEFEIIIPVETLPATVLEKLA